MQWNAQFASMPFISWVLLNAHTCVTQSLIRWGTLSPTHDVPSCSCPIRPLSHNRQLLFWFFSTKGSFACLRFSHEWSHTVYTLLCLISFEIFPCCCGVLVDDCYFYCRVTFHWVSMPGCLFTCGWTFGLGPVFVLSHSWLLTCSSTLIWLLT